MTTTAVADTIMAVINPINNLSSVASLSEKVDTLANRIAHWNVAYVIFFGLTVIVSALTLIASALIVWGNIKLHRLQTDLTVAKDTQLKSELQARDLEIAETKKRAAELEKEAAELRRLQGPRIIDHVKFLSELEGKPKMKVEILYQPDNDEAYVTAIVVNRWLGEGNHGDGAGWDVTPPRPIQAADAIPGWLDGGAPISARAGAWQGGAGIVVKAVPQDGKMLEPDSNAVSALWSALEASGLRAPMIIPDSRLPDDTLRLVIGGKM